MLYYEAAVRYENNKRAGFTIDLTYMNAKFEEIQQHIERLTKKPE